jgi:hypothetical protein
MATTTTSATFALPRDPVTKITGKPACAAVTNLRKELCENAMSARSAQGGQCGHLGMIMPPNEHNAVAGAQPWADPQNPSALNVSANATARQMALLSDTHNRQVKECNTFIVSPGNITGPWPGVAWLGDPTEWSVLHSPARGHLAPPA